jgi:hypothetical protein
MDAVLPAFEAEAIPLPLIFGKANCCKLDPKSLDSIHFKPTVYPGVVQSKMQYRRQLKFGSEMLVRGHLNAAKRSLTCGPRSLYYVKF